MAGLILYAAALLAGFLLGIFFFWGLWWSVRASIFSRWPDCLFLFGLVLRCAIAIFTFYSVAQAGWQKLVTCLVGFVLARFVIERMTLIPPEEADEAAAQRTGEGSNSQMRLGW